METISSGMVHSFEPNPKLCRRLQKNLDFNNLGKRCRLHKVALSSDSKNTFLYLDDCNHQMGSLRKSKSSNNYMEISTSTLDSLNLKRIDGIKIDVEGHEIDVIKGAIKTLSSFKPWLVVELNNSFHEVQKITQWEVYRLLTDIGYSTNFDTGQKLNPSFCRDIIYFDPSNSKREQFSRFL